jgi:hypothetical protein
MRARGISPRSTALTTASMARVTFRARVDRADDAFFYCIALSDALHAECIGDRHAAEPQRVPQQRFHHVLPQRRRCAAVAAERGKRDVRGHDEVGAGLDRRDKWHQLDRLEPVHVCGHDWEADVGIDVGVAMARKVFGRRERAARMCAAHEQRGQSRHARRVFPE